MTKPTSGSPAVLDLEDEPIDHARLAAGFRSIVETLWGFRRVLLIAVSATMLVYVVAASYAFLRAPVEAVGTQPFRLLFSTGSGAARSETYPGGLPFSTADIVSPPVVNAVFERNNLGRYMGVTELKNSLSVLQSSPEATILAADYESRLSDARLTPIDRARLEQEYRQKSIELPTTYVLSFVAAKSRSKIPGDLVGKTLNDVLSTWSEQAQNIRSAFKYQAPLMTAVIFSPEEISDPDPVRRTDALRGKVLRLIDSIGELEKLPGAVTIRRTPDGPSLPEIRANLGDLLQYQLEPLYLRIRQSGLVSNAEATIGYLESRLLVAERNAAASAGRKAALENAMRSYANEQTGSSAGDAPRVSSPSAQNDVTPQLSESFLDRLMSLSRRQEDIVFRQELVRRLTDASLEDVKVTTEERFYRQLISEIRQPRGGASEETGKDVLAALDRIQGAALKQSHQVRELYETLSEQNLNPRTGLFALSGPFSFRTQRAARGSDLLLYGLLLLVTAAVISILACLIYSYVRQELLHRSSSLASR